MQGKRHTVWITPAEKLEALRKIAQKRNLSLNAVINQALDEFIDRDSEETAAVTPTTPKKSRKQKQENSQPEDAGEVASGSKDPDPEDVAKEPFYLEPDGRIVGRWGRKEGRLIGYFTSLAEAERAVRS